MPDLLVYTFYKFTPLRRDRLPPLRAALLRAMQQTQVHGTILLAEEGINGALCGARPRLDSVLKLITKQPELTDLTPRKSHADPEIPPFQRRKVKIKREIVTLGVPSLAPLDPRTSGKAVTPREWNRLLADEEVVVVDARNRYETDIGTFPQALQPNTTNFRDFPEFAQRNLLAHKNKKIAMYCTGGIRCEKSTAYLRQLGFAHVFHLHGGILNYLAEIPAEQSHWRGECFVFDDRVSVDHHLKRGSYAQCNACRQPLPAPPKQAKQTKQPANANANANANTNTNTNTNTHTKNTHTPTEIICPNCAAVTRIPAS